MNQHLTPEQISKWMAGERTAQEELHVRECSQCAGEVEGFNAALQMFRGSVRRLSDKETGSVPQAIRHSRRVQPLRWAVAMAALLLTVAIPPYRTAMKQRHQQEMAKADAALLEQIDAEVSRAVPAPMEPLIGLVDWDSTSARGGGNKTR